MLYITQIVRGNNRKLMCYERYEYIRHTMTIAGIFGIMIFQAIALLFIIFRSKANNIIDNAERRPLPETLQDFLLQEVILENLFNPMSTFQEDRALVTNVFDPTFSTEREVTFELYTRRNPTKASFVKLGDTETLNSSSFISTRPTKIIVHGWTDSSNTFWLSSIRRNYLIAGDFNVICVSWYPGSAKEYFVSARLTRQVGAYLAEFIKFLVTEAFVSLDDVHILGHSLGAHIAGYAGVAMSGKIGRITGMDPAAPGFEMPRLKDQKDRLDSTDAKFVDVIHTCAGTLGFSRPIGHADFYPNGGTFRQPGCSVLLTQYCSHGRSHEYVAESIIRPTAFIAEPCNSWTDFKAGKCKDNATTAVMGENIDKATRGSFYLDTNPESPFGRN